jgi:hypothetical protein
MPRGAVRSAALPGSDGPASVQVDGDSIVPDADVQLALSRGAMEGLLADPLAALRALLADALAAAGVAPDALAAVEVVGGGARIPCIVDEVRRAVGGAALSRTLDSSAAVALGAAGLARYWAAREAGVGVADGAEGAAAEWSGVAMEGAWLDGAGGAGMDADAIAGAASDEEMLQGKERLRAEREGARNSLEEWVYQMRDATAGPFAEHLKPAEVNADLDGIEEWLWSEEGESAGAEALRARLAAAKLAMEEKFPVFFEERHLDQVRPWSHCTPHTRHSHHHRHLNLPLRTFLPHQRALLTAPPPAAAPEAARGGGGRGGGAAAGGGGADGEGGSRQPGAQVRGPLPDGGQEQERGDGAVQGRQLQASRGALH